MVEKSDVIATVANAGKVTALPNATSARGPEITARVAKGGANENLKAPSPYPKKRRLFPENRRIRNRNSSDVWLFPRVTRKGVDKNNMRAT
jgi:hypothetical protein